MSFFIDNCGFIPTLGGTTDWTYSSTVGGYQSPTQAGAVSGTTYAYRAQSADLTQWEIGTGAYSSAGAGSFARTTVLYNSSGTTSKINFTLAPGLVAIVALTTDMSRTARTRQVFTSGSGTYTTPAACRAINIRMVGGGGGGGGGNNATPGTAGGSSTFTTYTAGGGSAGVGGTSGQNPTSGGTASGSPDWSVPGGQGGPGMNYGGSNVVGGGGGNSSLGGGGGASNGGNTAGNAATNSGGGGGGGGVFATTLVAGSGGAAGATLEKLIVSPSATYSYAVGAGGAGAAAGTSGGAGGTGAAGIIIVDEFY